MSSLLLAAVFWAVEQALPGTSAAAAVLGYLAFTNLLLGAFNLIPGFPLDGGRVFRSIVWGLTNSFKRGTIAAAFAGQAFGWLLIVWGVARVLLFGDLVGGIWTAFIGWFLNNAAESTRQEQTFRETLRGVTAANLMDTPPVVATPDVSVQDFVMDYVMRRGQRAVPVVDELGRLVGIVSLTDARKLPQQTWPTIRVDQIMTPAPLTMSRRRITWVGRSA